MSELDELLKGKTEQQKQVILRGAEAMHGLVERLIITRRYTLEEAIAEVARTEKRQEATVRLAIAIHNEVKEL